LHYARTDEFETVLREHLIKELHLPDHEELDISTTLSVVIKFFNNIQLKAFNICFPHIIRELENGKEMVIYLKHVSKYQDQVLDSIIECQQDLSEIIDIYLEDIINSYALTDHARIYLNSLDYNDEELLQKDIHDKTIVRLVLKDIKSIKKLFNTITDLNRSHSELLTYLNDYKHLIAIVKDFQKSLQSFIDTNEVNMKTLILSLIKASKFVRENYRLNQPNESHREVISFMHGKIKFKFDSALVSAIQQFMCMTTINDDIINEIASKYEDKWKNIISAGIRNPFDIKIYDKVGKLARYPLAKRYRIALGFHIMKYILLKIEVARNTARKTLSIQIV
jgi:hypothetical protein